MNSRTPRVLGFALILMLTACDNTQDSTLGSAPNQVSAPRQVQHTTPTRQHSRVVRHDIQLDVRNTLEPYQTLSIENDILDLVVHDGRMLVSSVGFIAIYDLHNLEPVSRFEFDKIENFYGDLNFPRLYSADLSRHDDRIVFVKETASGKTVVQMQYGSEETTLIPEDENLAIRKIRFLDEHRILMATIESEAVIYDLRKSMITYKKQLSHSSFSDFAINPKSHDFVFATESGAIPLVDGDTGEIKTIIEGGNLDDIYSIEFADRVIITAGKDRSVSVYNLDSNLVEKFTSEFYFFAISLNTGTQSALFVVNEANQVGLFDLDRQKVRILLNGAGKSIEVLKFINQHQALGATYNQILFWSF
jgi:WD40 repeat protein